MLFTTLVNNQTKTPNTTGSDTAYLGAQVQSDVARLTPIIEDALRIRIKQLQSAKKKMIESRLGTRNFEHPSFNELNLNDTSSIHRFLARENIKCALICDPFQPLEQLSMLCDIINSEYNMAELFPHISIFRGYEEAKVREDSKEDLATYFKIHLTGIIQDPKEQVHILDEFKKIILIG